MKAETKEKKTQRSLASQPTSFRPYEDTYEEVIKLCQATGRKPAEELRDLLDEGLKARSQCNGHSEQPSQQSPADNRKIDEIVDLLHQTLQVNAEQSDLIEALTRHQREQYGLLLEVLAAAYAARQILWTYIAEPSLREAGLTPEQIRLRLEEERQRWNAERDSTADLLEQAIQNLGSVG